MTSHLKAGKHQATAALRTLGKDLTRKALEKVDKAMAQNPLTATPDVGPSTTAPPVGGLDLTNIQGDILYVEIST